MYEFLNLINLGKESSLIYKRLLEVGPMTASEIAIETKLVRSSCYSYVAALVEKGLVSKTLKDGVNVFIPESPDRVVKILMEEKRKQELKLKIARDLNRKYKKKFLNKDKKKSQPLIKYYEGERSIIEAYIDTLNCKDKTIYSYVNIKEMRDSFIKKLPSYYKVRKEKGIFLKTICPSNLESINRSELDAHEQREIRFIDSKYSFDTETTIYDDNILFVSWKDRMAIKVKSEKLANFHKNIFNVLFSKLDS